MKTDEVARAEGGYRSLFQRIPVPLYRSTLHGEALAVNPAKTIAALAERSAARLVEEGPR